MSDPVEQLQNLIYQRLLNNAYFADVVVRKGEDGINASDIAKALGTATQKSGKKGALVVVDRPFRDVDTPDMPGPEWLVRIPVGVYEHRTTNRGAGGTNKHIEELISKVAGKVHHFMVQHLGTQVTMDGEAVAPVISPADPNQLIAELMFTARINQKPEEKCSMPKVGGEADAVIILAGSRLGITPGAAVYYTTDGTYPTPDNGTFYGFVLLNDNGQPLLSDDGQPLHSDNTPEPFAVAAGTLVLANAWKDGLLESDLAGKQF